MSFSLILSKKSEGDIVIASVRPFVCTHGWTLLFLWPRSLAVPVLARWVYGFLWFYVQELPKAQPAVVLVLKRLRRRGNGLKSHPTDWEKPGIEPATPGLQDIGLSPTPRRMDSFFPTDLPNLLVLIVSSNL